MKKLLPLLLFLWPLQSWGADDTTAMDTAWLMTAAALVFLMQAGFALLESGMSRAKNAINVVMKNYMDVCIGTMVFWAIGYGIMFGDNPSGFFGLSEFFPEPGSSWDASVILFQIMFAATAATIASGAMAERTRYHSYLIGAVVIIGLIYPVVGSWIWNGDGWLAQQGFVDFAGSTVVHSTGAWCALAGIIMVGPRTGRFDYQGKPQDIPGHNLNLVALGGFILWFGWFGFNGGSTLAADASIGRINLNTQLAAGAGAAGAMLMSKLMGKPIMLTNVVNGSLAGLVAITAGCATTSTTFAVITGFIGGIITIMGYYYLLHLRLDDVVGAVAVHGFAGVWGTIAAGLFYEGDMFNSTRVFTQLVGIFAVFLWTFVISLLTYLVISKTLGLRASTQHEQRGLDITEHAELGYPEFNQNTAYDRSIVSAIQKS